MFCRSHRQTFRNNLFSQLDSSIFIRNGKNSPCMTSGKLTVKDELLDWLWKI